jgi:hypothetical protein
MNETHVSWKSSYQKMLNYAITCKECDWEVTTDSSADVVEEGRKHRAWHDKRGRIAMQRAEERRQALKQLRCDIQREKDFLERMKRAPEIIERTEQKIIDLETRLIEMETA